MLQIKGSNYLKVLNNHLLPFGGIHQPTHFMQDSVPTHRIKHITKWLKERDIPVLEWPGNFPDLNPIENV